MCGLFGAVGPNINHHVVRCLAVLNEARGSDAVGFFNSSGNLLKTAEKATTALREKDFTDFIRESASRCWAVCGHTRAGTRGGAVTKNAHPFEYGSMKGRKGGSIIGSHNGIINNAPNSYSVDSEFAFDELSKFEPGEYQKALGKMMGWYMLTWLDNRNGCIYFLSWTQGMCMQVLGDTLYYSSADTHLATATGRKDKIIEIKSGDVFRLSPKSDRKFALHKLENFSGSKYEYDTRSKGHNGHHYNGTSNRARFDEGGDPTDTTGWIKKLPNGKLYALTNSSVLLPLKDQEKLLKKYDRMAEGSSRFIGFKELEEYLDKEETKKLLGPIREDDDTIVLTPSQAAQLADAVIDESAMEAADLELAKSQAIETGVAGKSSGPSEADLEAEQAKMDAEHEAEKKKQERRRRRRGELMAQGRDLSAIEQMIEEEEQEALRRLDYVT